MAFPRTRFNRPTSFRMAAAVPSSSAVIIEPTLGFNKSQPGVDLAPGMTPDSANFVIEDGYLTPRSGLSTFGESNTSLADVGLLATEHHDVDGNRYPIVGSAQTLIWLNSASWSTLSYVVRGTGHGSEPLSGTSVDHIYTASVYEPNIDDNWLVIGNGLNVPKVWHPSDATYSDLSDFVSVESIGRIPYSLDDRLCFFNCATSGVSFPTRVRWSERGNTSKFSTVGAGFEDLMDMRGVGTGVSRREFDALLFTTEEVWLQRPRRDNYAYDFSPLARTLGCPYPKTIANTPQGTMFLTRELEPYIVSGTNIMPVGKSVHQYLRDEIRNVDFSFGLYNSRRQRYEFYYDSDSSDGRPHRGLYLDMDSGAWMPIDLHGYEVGAGAEVGADLGSDILWDNLEATWDEMEATWNSMVGSASFDKDVMLVSSAGTVYRMREDQSTDDGSAITAKWTSHAMAGEDPTRKTSLDGFWAEYEAEDSGSYTLEVRGTPYDNFPSGTARSYAAATRGNKLSAAEFVTGDHPQFRITVSDGKRPKFARFVAKLRDAGQR